MKRISALIVLLGLAFGMLLTGCNQASDTSGSTTTNAAPPPPATTNK